MFKLYCSLFIIEANILVIFRTSRSIGCRSKFRSLFCMSVLHSRRLLKVQRLSEICTMSKSFIACINIFLKLFASYCSISLTALFGMSIPNRSRTYMRHIQLLATKIYFDVILPCKRFFTKRRKVDAKYIKTWIKFVLFYSLFQRHDVQQELSQNN